ncbi:conserved hypothetical protein [Desulfatibacillum aliphaticivorans]|uniref:Rad50/SbcC-type AAA domain-containing protein n=1 Tax=Desulfatibacillum aliphaticivorans TaxID=218208 RepID=B8FD40_DESAL|nr:AAA family ATPase [Desulfatibacillum aliphaticivorans]ACL06471.1 conserved hypothetical protein [Desulfatibacillum aliphaticivorans]
MNLIALRIENFRQFYGVHEIEFAKGNQDQNVTVFHGYNGSGKTALLNAFIWCLYGETTPDFESPDRLSSEKAIAEIEPGKSIEVSIRLSFSIRSVKYIVQRSIKCIKVNVMESRYEKEELEMWKVVDGELETLSDSDRVRQRYINQMLPKGLYPFFFFNGERVEWMASPSAYDEVEKGITTLLDVKIYERAYYDLKTKVTRELSKELRSFGDDSLREALENEDKLKEEENDIIIKLRNFKDSLAKNENETKVFEDRQSEIEHLKGLTDKRNSLREREKGCKKDLLDQENSLKKQVSKNGFLSFGEEVFKKTEKLVADARERGELPAKIKPQFVKDLLEDKKCICGRLLEPGQNDAEIAQLEDWRRNVGLAEFEEAISQTSAAIPNLIARRDEFFSEIDAIQSQRNETIGILKSIQEELDTLGESLGDSSYGEEAGKLAERLKTLNREAIDIKADTKYWNSKLKENTECQSTLRRQIIQLQVQDEKAKTIKNQKESVERVAEALEQIYNIQKEHVREDLAERISKIWDDAAIKDYKASITPDFKLDLTKHVAGNPQPVHGTSTGEKQVLALSFVGSLVQKAKVNMEEAGNSPQIGIPLGGEYPLVMDSAFGSLEDDYRAKIAEWIPTLAHQVIMLVSKTQWRNEVESMLENKIGKQYILELHTPKEGSDRSIEIAGENYPYVVSIQDPAESTKIVPV